MVALPIKGERRKRREGRRGRREGGRRRPQPVRIEVVKEQAPLGYMLVKFVLIIGLWKKEEKAAAAKPITVV